MNNKKRRFLAVLLAICLIMGALPVSSPMQAFAETYTPDGNPGYTLEYTVNEDSTVSITGINVAEGLEETELAVEIPSVIDGMAVTKIADPDYWDAATMFSSYHITSVSIPASVTEIEAGVFANCQYLTNVTFAEGCEPAFTEEYTGSYSGVFQGCTSLESIVLPVGTKTLAKNMFCECEKLKSVNLKELTALTEIPDAAFAGTALETVELPDNVVTVGSAAFYKCVSQPDNDGNTHESIQSITLNEGLQTIEGNAFAYSGITELALPDSLTTLGSDLFSGGAFSWCDSLTSIKWPENNLDFTTVAGFEGCYRLPNTIFSTFPVSVTTLGYHAFGKCEFTEVTLPNTIVELGERAFLGNAELASVNLPDSLEKIGESAFEGCGSLRDVTVTIPENVSYIGPYAFQYDSWPYGGAVDLKILNPDISLKDENGDFIEIFVPVRDSILRGYRYKSNGGDSDVYAYAQDAATKIAEYDDEYACTFIPLTETQSYTVSGTVKPGTAEITAAGGGVSQNPVLDENGVFSFTVTNDEDAAVTFSAEGYFSQTFVRAAGSTGDWNLGDVELTELPVSRTVTVSLSDSEGKSLSGFDGLTLTLKAGESTLAEGTDYTLQFPYIVLNENVSVTRDTTLTLTAEVVDESLQRSGATAATTLARPRLELVLPAWGNAVIPTVSSFVGGHNVLIFDSNGKLAEYGVVASTKANEAYSYTTGKLKAGSYTAVIFNQNKYLSVIPTLSALTSCGMAEDTDYRKIAFSVRDKETTAIDTVTVPVLNTAGFSTIVDTDFSSVRLDENSPLTGVKFRARVFYGFADEAAKSGTLTINIPADAAISYIGNETGKLEENNSSNGYTRSGNTLMIPVSRNKGVVFMDMAISGTGSRSISASLSDGTKTSPLGSCAFDCYTTRLTLPSEYFESRLSAITATVKAKPQTAVEMYLDGEKKGTVTTDKLGTAYFDFNPPTDAAIGQWLTISTRTAEGDGASAVIKNYPSDAIVKEFYFTQYHYKYYVVKDGELTKNLSYNYFFRDSERDESKDWSFSATINAKEPLDEELTTVTITMKTGDTMEVPLYVSSKTVREDGSTDYVFTGMVTLEHPGIAPNYFEDERVPVRLDLNYASILDDSVKTEWAQQGQSNTQNLMAELTANTALTEEEEEEINDKYENPWTEEFLNEYSASLEQDFCEHYYYNVYCADPENPTAEEKAQAEAAAKADVAEILEPLTTTDQDEIDDMVDMLFGDEYMIELEDEVLSYATEEEQQQLYEFQSSMLTLQSSIKDYCGYVSAGLLLDKNLTDYEDGIEIAEEMGITLSTELAAKAEDGTLEDYMKTVSVGEVEQAEDSDVVYAYDQNGKLLYSVDTAKQWEKVLANTDIINNGNVESALPGGNGAVAALSLDSYGDGVMASTKSAPQDAGGEEQQDSLALAHDELEAAVAFGGNYWLGLAGTAAGEGSKAIPMLKSYQDFVQKAPTAIKLYSKYIDKSLHFQAKYMTEAQFQSLCRKLSETQRKLSAATKIPPALEKMGTVLGKAGDVANTAQLGNDLIDVYSLNNEIKNWEDEVERHNKLFYHYLNLETKDCESFPTKFDCTAAHRTCMDEARTLQRLNKKLQMYAGIDAVVTGGTLASSFIPGVGWAASLTIATGGYLYGKVADKGKAQLQAEIAIHVKEFKKGESAAKKYCKIEREDCPDDDTNSSGSTGKGTDSSSSGNIVLGSGSIGSDMRECLDPSGVVYEAVESNPLSDATAELWYSASEDGTGAVKWDAENYGGQINPQITGADGMYSWYVPNGYWKVKVTKDGYTAKETDWMEVLPPRFDVNIGLISTASPAVQSINAYPDYVEIIFTQYMRVTDALTVSSGYTYEWAEKTPVNSESSTYYSKVLRLIPNDKAEVGDTVSVTVSGAKNYAGTSLPEYSSGSLIVVPRPDKLVLNYEDKVSVQMGENPTPRVTVRVLDSDGEPISGLNVMAAASSDFYASISAVNATTGKDGMAVFSVEGQLPGTTKLNLSVENTSLSTSIPLVVTNTENRPERPTAQVGSTSLTALSPKENFVTVRSGETMTLSCATEGAVIYYTTDGTCPCQNTANRMKYTVPITLTENTKFRIAAYKDGMDYSERLNITVTIDEEHQHSYSEEWKYDEESHWHECSCGVVCDKAVHDMEVQNAKEATAAEPGYTGDKVCKVCGYTETGKEIPTGGTNEPGNSGEPGNPGEPDANNVSEINNPDKVNDAGAKRTSTNPETGDNTNPVPWAAVLFVSSSGMIGIIIWDRKKKKHME